MIQPRAAPTAHARVVALMTPPNVGADSKVAERVGFEPTNDVDAVSGLAHRCLEPLGHLSVSTKRVEDRDTTVAHTRRTSRSLRVTLRLTLTRTMKSRLTVNS